jgi:hypothetical protein
MNFKVWHASLHPSEGEEHLADIKKKEVRLIKK